MGYFKEKFLRSPVKLEVQKTEENPLFDFIDLFAQSWVLLVEIASNHLDELSQAEKDKLAVLEMELAMVKDLFAEKINDI